MIGDLIDLAQPLIAPARVITAIHLHHEGGGDELDDADEVERMAMSRADQRFARIPYHFVVFRRVGDEDSRAAPTAGNPWVVTEGRPLGLVPASVRGLNEGAVAIVVSGRWDLHPLPIWAQDRVVEVCVWLCRSLGLGVGAIHGHGELAPTLCPGYAVDHIRVRVRELL